MILVRIGSPETYLVLEEGARSSLHCKNLGDVQWEEQYGLQVLALHDASGVLQLEYP